MLVRISIYVLLISIQTGSPINFYSFWIRRPLDDHIHIDSIYPISNPPSTPPITQPTPQLSTPLLTISHPILHPSIPITIHSVSITTPNYTIHPNLSPIFHHFTQLCSSVLYIPIPFQPFLARQFTSCFTKTSLLHLIQSKPCPVLHCQRLQYLDCAKVA